MDGPTYTRIIIYDMYIVYIPWLGRLIISRGGSKGTMMVNGRGKVLMHYTRINTVLHHVGGNEDGIGRGCGGGGEHSQ